jgi:AraC-like DNA-binding protein
MPFVIDTGYHLIVFAQGSAFVHQWEMQVHNPYLGMPLFVLNVAQQFLYLYWALQLYQAYRVWIKTQFSETDTISFRWFRNFLIAVTITLVFSLIMTLIDLWLDLDYWQDWWGNLVGVVLIYYVSIAGYAQIQPGHRLTFRVAESVVPLVEKPVGESAMPVPLSAELLVIRDRLLTYMTTERPYLDPDLTLADLARRLKTSPALLSQAINVGVGRNFNDFVNEYRVEGFKQQARDPANAHLSLLGIALDCGFNSKATFNRAFRKFTNQSPGEFLAVGRSVTAPV